MAEFISLNCCHSYSSCLGITQMVTVYNLQSRQSLFIQKEYCPLLYRLLTSSPEAWLGQRYTAGLGGHGDEAHNGHCLHQKVGWWCTCNSSNCYMSWQLKVHTRHWAWIGMPWRGLHRTQFVMGKGWRTLVLQCLHTHSLWCHACNLERLTVRSCVNSSNWKKKSCLCGLLSSRQRLAAALLPLLLGNNVPGHTKGSYR